jgi:LemA protein
MTRCERSRPLAPARLLLLRPADMSRTLIVVLALLGLVVFMPAGCGVSSYNRLVGLDQAVQSQWAQVENAYQRRLDLVPNLVETVKGAAAFEKDTFTAVTEARTRAAQAGAVVTQSPGTEAISRYQGAQDQLTSALSRLMVVVEHYPDLKATQNFRDLQTQLEGTENRIAIERMRYNEAAQAFNTVRQSFPTTVFAGFFGDRFREKGYFHAAEGAEHVPRVQF